MTQFHCFYKLLLVSCVIKCVIVNEYKGYHNPLLRYVTKFQPQYPNVYQPWPMIPYQGSCAEGTIQAIPSDCSKYNQCVNAEYVTRSCATGLHWNSALSICDWPASAKCNESPAAGIQESGNDVQVIGGGTDDDDVTVVVPVTAVPAVTLAPITSSPVTSVPASSQDTGMKVVCYFTNWAWYRSEPGKYDPSDIDTGLCTHVNFGFVVLHPTDLVIKVHDPWSDVDNKFFTRVSGLKNKGIRTLVALGGWNDSEGNKYSRMVATKASRTKFIASALQFIEKYGFEGLDLDWEYPVCWQVDCEAGPSEDKENFSALVKELSEEFKPRGLLLTAAVSPSKKVIDAGYDVPALNKYLDIINVMTYDYYGHWDKKTGHVAPLYHHPELPNPTFSANYTMNYWHSKGADKNKLVMGMPMYGQTFTLGNPSENGLNASAPAGGGNKGRFTGQKGFASYYEICAYVSKEGYKLVYDNENRIGPYAYKGNQWVGFDDVETIRRKSQYIKDNGFGGGMIWALDLDDFNNNCGCEKYPLLKTINRVLRNYNSPDPHCTLDSNTIPYYQNRQQDLTIPGGNPPYYFRTPASTYPLLHAPFFQGGQNTVPYLRSAASQNINNLKNYNEPTSAYSAQRITSYPMVNHLSPWANVLFQGR